jgi:hypothetical protein
VLDLPANLHELIKKSFSGNQVNFSFGLAHSVGSQGDEDSIVLQELYDGNPRHLHVEELLIVIVELALRLVDFHELENHILVDVVSDRLFYLLHVEIKLLLGPGSLVGKSCEELVDEFLRFYLLEEVGDHLVD